MTAKTPYWRPSRKTISHEELMAFAERLGKRMVELGWTQADMAREAFGVDKSGNLRDRSSVSRWLRGQGLPGEAKMRQLAKVLRMPLEELAPKLSDISREKAAATRPAGHVDSPLPRGLYSRHTNVEGVRVNGARFDGVRIDPVKGGAMLIVHQRLLPEDAAAIYAAIAKAAARAAG